MQLATFLYKNAIKSVFFEIFGIFVRSFFENTSWQGEHICYNLSDKILEKKILCKEVVSKTIKNARREDKGENTKT